MGWHDVTIYGMLFDGNVAFDIDYIFRWETPIVPDTSYKFWISPATLIFIDPTYLRIDISTDFVNGVEIADILQIHNNGKSVYRIETQQGDMEIEAVSFRQVIRMQPVLSVQQFLPPTQRGGISFSEEIPTE